MEIILKLHVDKINVIMEALSNAPYKAVADIINSIQQQAGPQLQAPALPEGNAPPAEMMQ